MSTQNKFLDFKGLLHFYDSVIKNHNALSYTYYKTHPEEIVNLPKEIIYKYFPEVLMIVEPLSSDIFVVKEGASTNPILHVDDGVITIDKVKEIYKSNNWEFDPTNTQIILDPYSCSAINYYNISNCEITPKEIVKLPKETIYKYFPDILMIIEPLNGSVTLPKLVGVNMDWNIPENIVINTTNGLITKDMVRTAARELGMDSFGEVFTLSSYNCSAIRYANLQGMDGARLIPAPSCTIWTSYTEEPENKLRLVEGFVGWENLVFNQFAWWTQVYYWNKRQLWWDNKITINGDWYLSDENIVQEPFPEDPTVNVRNLKLFNCECFVRLEGLEATIDREIEFNGTIYFPSRVNYNCCPWMFTNLRCYQYPTIDFTRCKYTQLTENLKEESEIYFWEGIYLNGLIQNRNFTWTPERPQKCIVKGLGYGLIHNGYASLQGIIDWNYDDMIASLITYANNSVENPGSSSNGVQFNISQKSYDKLTKDDLAAIVAMGNSIAVV